MPTKEHNSTRYGISSSSSSKEIRCSRRRWTHFKHKTINKMIECGFAHIRCATKLCVCANVISLYWTDLRDAATIEIFVCARICFRSDFVTGNMYAYVHVFMFENYYQRNVAKGTKNWVNIRRKNAERQQQNKNHRTRESERDKRRKANDNNRVMILTVSTLNHMMLVCWRCIDSFLMPIVMLRPAHTSQQIWNSNWILCLPSHPFSPCSLPVYRFISLSPLFCLSLFYFLFVFRSSLALSLRNKVVRCSLLNLWKLP